MKRIGFHAIALAVALSGCTSGQSGTVPAVTPVNVTKTATLQFAVGTANIGTMSGPTTGLNVVATFRGSDGNNATSVNTPTLTGPPALNFGTLLGGTNVVSGVTPSQFALLGKQLTAYAHAFAAGQPATPPALYTTNASGFGPIVGVFGYGLAADNLISNTDTSTVLAALQPLVSTPCLGIATAYYPTSFYSGQPNFGKLPGNNGNANPSNAVRSAELALPISSGSGSAVMQNPGSGSLETNCPSNTGDSAPFIDPNFPVQFFGGPPAWPSAQGYGTPAYFIGFPLGFSTFTASPVSGSYTLSVQFPTSADDSTYGTLSATSTLRSSASVLGAFAQPTLQINRTDGSGTLNVNVPAGASEAVVEITASSCDYVAHFGAFNHYSVLTKNAGAQTLFISGSLGPPSTAGQPTHTFCTPSDVAAYNAASAVTGAAPQGSLFDTVTVTAIGADYPLYESSYPFNTSPAPPITNGDGHTGQADVTVSYPAQFGASVPAPAGGS